ncbi:PREDICTED: uncharacterized protein LOC108561684 [Nicrophorus vespilloides]|uniref:Uncharacterized protein LOC108561684 n=1 Tax=Nicrophorus vespilloides TaxID=110193 RepID=A0ABM1MKY3_NICVS|nr:PREDICTED: uncharacterized protein LOC108561684 [Nicrophorus vespilloides]
MKLFVFLTTVFIVFTANFMATATGFEGFPDLRNFTRDIPKNINMTSMENGTMTGTIMMGPPKASTYGFEGFRDIRGLTRDIPKNINMTFMENETMMGPPKESKSIYEESNENMTSNHNMNIYNKMRIFI